MYLPNHQHCSPRRPFEYAAATIPANVRICRSADPNVCHKRHRHHQPLLLRHLSSARPTSCCYCRLRSVLAAKSWAVARPASPHSASIWRRRSRGLCLFLEGGGRKWGGFPDEEIAWTRWREGMFSRWADDVCCRWWLGWWNLVIAVGWFLCVFGVFGLVRYLRFS